MAENESQESLPQSPQPTEIPQDLKEKLSAARALALTHKLLTTGIFQGNSASQVVASLNFVESLHGQMLEDIKALPQASLVVELQQKQGN